MIPTHLGVVEIIAGILADCHVTIRRESLGGVRHRQLEPSCKKPPWVFSFVGKRMEKNSTKSKTQAPRLRIQKHPNYKPKDLLTEAEVKELIRAAKAAHLKARKILGYD